MSFKLDLHTHSYGSPDGSLSLKNYRYFLQNNLLDYIAITDHNSLETAQHIQAQLGELGKRIIIGEEIMTTEGEIIGLYLTETVPAGLTPPAALQAVQQQGGLVYIPHPFETVRDGIAKELLNAIGQDVDIVETRNGRSVFQNLSRSAAAWAAQHAKPAASSSDAHGRFGWGYTYSVIEQPPTKENLAGQLQKAGYNKRSVGLGVIYPKLNRLKRKLRRASV